MVVLAPFCCFNRNLCNNIHVSENTVNTFRNNKPRPDTRVFLRRVFVLLGQSTARCLLCFHRVSQCRIPGQDLVWNLCLSIWDSNQNFNGTGQWVAFNDLQHYHFSLLGIDIDFPYLGMWRQEAHSLLQRVCWYGLVAWNKQAAALQATAMGCLSCGLGQPPFATWTYHQSQEPQKRHGCLNMCVFYSRGASACLGFFFDTQIFVQVLLFQGKRDF